MPSFPDNARINPFNYSIGYGDFVASWIGSDGKKLIGLGIDEENVSRLRDGKPIVVNGEPFGFDGEILIFYGKDKGHLLSQMHDAGLQLPPVVNIGK